VGEDSSADVDFAVVGTGSQIDIALAATAMGKPVEYLYERNPALKRWATHPSGPHRLIVDAADRQAAIDAIEGLGDQRLRWQRVRVEANDTLGHFALRFGTDVATLRQMNGLPTTLIRTGDELLVPVAGIARRAGSDIYGQRNSGAKDGSAFVYIVRAGDSIWRIARRLGVTRKALMQANGVGPRDILRIGQRLAVP
ncbi:MAG: LysM peptidoglycan-binding domain-containing protein, partial [Gammaproteobacteria bacterium]|nr:LysM peptidoglycan-binding domain-containing protein [Gammaproteobacteria bacterium]